MPLFDEEFRREITAAVERTIRATLSAQGGRNLGGSQNPLLPSGSLAEATIVPGFGTGYDGTETTVPFTSDISEAGGGGGFAGTDIVTM